MKHLESRLRAHPKWFISTEKKATEQRIAKVCDDSQRVYILLRQNNARNITKK